jgi:hypothetical protein
MRQLLMLGFYCEVYKREPLCRVYINDVLVDEFNIPHTPQKEIEWNSDIILDPKFLNRTFFTAQSNPTFCKYIELDNGEATALDLRVEIQNNDNNYANGFMTNHTRVMLLHCFLLSKNTLERLDSMQNDFKFSRKNQHKYYKKKNIVDYYAVPNSNRTGIFDNFANYMNLHFPDITQHPQSEEQLKLHYSNHQDLPVLWQVNPAEHWIGSSGYCHLTLKKKLGFWRLSTDRRRSCWWMGEIDTVKYLYDKYLRYEN